MPFSRPPLNDLINRAAQDIETRLPGTDARLRRSNLGVLSRVHSGAVHGLYGFLSWIAKQILPDTSDAEILDRQADVWGVTRKAAASALGNVTFAGTAASVIPAGSTLQRADGVTFETVAIATIGGGGTVLAQVVAVTGGLAGNTAAGATLSLVSPIVGVQSAAVVDASGLVNGADVETDDALRARLLARIQQPPHGGADFDYTNWALEVAGVTRAWVFPQESGAGTVVVRFVVDNDPVSIIPAALKVAEVQAYIDFRRPVTANVTIIAPVDTPLDITVTGLSPNTPAVQAAVEAQLQDLLHREAVPGGTILLSHIREAVSIATGETDNDVTVPAADVTHTTGQLPTLGTVTYA